MRKTVFFIKLNTCLKSPHVTVPTSDIAINYQKLLQIKKNIISHLSNMEAYIFSNDLNCGNVDIFMRHTYGYIYLFFSFLFFFSFFSQRSL